MAERPTVDDVIQTLREDLAEAIDERWVDEIHRLSRELAVMESVKKFEGSL